MAPVYYKGSLSVAPDGSAVSFIDTNGNLYILDGNSGIAKYGYNRTGHKLYGSKFSDDS